MYRALDHNQLSGAVHLQPHAADMLLSGTLSLASNYFLSISGYPAPNCTAQCTALRASLASNCLLGAGNGGPTSTTNTTGTADVTTTPTTSAQKSSRSQSSAAQPLAGEAPPECAVPEQRDAEYGCKAFCSATASDGPCGGLGFCYLGDTAVPTCECFPGARRNPLNPAACDPVMQPPPPSDSAPPPPPPRPVGRSEPHLLPGLPSHSGPISTCLTPHCLPIMRFTGPLI